MFFRYSISCFFFFFNDTATTEIYTLSLHDALPISKFRPRTPAWGRQFRTRCCRSGVPSGWPCWSDRKSTRLNSSHEWISYAVFCLKKKKKKENKDSMKSANIRAKDTIHALSEAGYI